MPKSAGREVAQKRRVNGKSMVALIGLLTMIVGCVKLYLERGASKQLQQVQRLPDAKLERPDFPRTQPVIDFNSEMGKELAMLALQWTKDPNDRSADWDSRANKLTGQYAAQIKQFRLVERMNPRNGALAALDELNREDLPYTAYLIAVVYDYWGESLEDERGEPTSPLPRAAAAKYESALTWYEKADISMGHDHRMQARALFNRAAVNMSLAQHDGNKLKREAALRKCMNDCERGLSLYPMAIGFGTYSGAASLLGDFTLMDRVLRTGLNSREAEEQNPGYLPSYIMSPAAQKKEFAPAVQHFGDWTKHILELKNQSVAVAQPAAAS